MKTSMVVQWSALALIPMLLTGCYIQSDLTLNANQDLELNRMLLSIDQSPAVVEAAIRHAFTLMGMGDAFNIREYKTGAMTMEDYMLLTPTKKMIVPKNTNSGDKISVTPMGEQKKFEWIVEQRAQAFSRRLEDSDTK